MDSGLVGQVRRFNRTVTQRIGALNDAFLARGRPLGQARVLWEIGPSGSDVRALRSRLDLDSGYLSRLLRSLEQDGLVAVGRSGSDGRVRTARLTPRGLAERIVLDRRSDDAAVAILEPLSDRQRTRLVTAMAEVERLLVASAGAIPGIRTRGSACAPTSPNWLSGSTVASTRTAAFRPTTRNSPRPRACCWSPPCTASRSGAARSSSTTAPRRN